MDTIVTKENGKSYGRVYEGGRVIHTTPGYLTNQMALAAAHCWIAFHGKDETMAEPETVWVPVAPNAEVELPYADVMRIAIDFQAARNAERSDVYKGKRMMRTLRKWASETHGLTDMRELAAVSRWWWTVDAKARVERGRRAAEQIAHQRRA